MRNQSLLVIFVAVCVATATTAPPDKDAHIDDHLNDITKSDNEKFKPDPKVPKALDERFNKMIPYPKLEDIKTTKEETSTIAFEPYKDNDDEVEHDMLKDISHADIGKNDYKSENYDDIDPSYDDYYDDEFSDEEEDEDEDRIEDEEPQDETKPIKTEKKAPEDEEFDEEYTDDEVDEEEEDDLVVDINKSNMEMKQCPRDCICERNMQAYFVATCSRLDLETQSFANLPITDLQVIDIGPQYPIVLGVEFFKKIGLANVTSIKIANSSIEYISPSAFNGLKELYSVNLTSIGIDLIHPDTFANNTKLKILILSGNNLNVMQSLSSPYTDYMLKSPSIEELDISNCNMQEFLPTAFSQMKNIIYINLAGNKLTTLPQGLFDRTDTIEELDLSYNMIATLPKNIFNRTSLGMLHLKYNEIVSNLEFVTKDVQKLDLSYNRIVNVNNQMFKGIENLSNLMLKGNLIKRIHPGSFLTLKNLRYIDLSFNQLDQINSLTFLKNPNLEVIRINDNIRLKTLPSEGFETAQKSFNVFMLDASNCDLSTLSENTFKSMPFITRLYLSGNNIEKVPKNLFSPLVRLMELDLSNNLFNNLDPQIFWNNQDLNKLNLNANPIESLSTKIFAPTPYLEELDISDCDLISLWHDSSKQPRVGEFLKNLKVFNASNNDIKNIYASDLSTMKNLKVFDLKNNPLECNDDFRSLMKFLGLRKVTLGNRNAHNEFDDLKPTFFEEMSPAVEWNELARKICKRNEEERLTNEQVLDEIDESDEEYEDEDMFDEDSDEDDIDENAELLPVNPKEKTTKKPVVVTKAPKEKSTVKPKTTKTTTRPAVVDSENNNNESDDEYDYEEDDDEDDDDDEEDREDESIVEDENMQERNKDILLNGVKIIKEFDNRIFGGDDEDETEEVVIEEAATQYRFIWPMLIAMLSIVVILLLIMNVIAFFMRKRGERYREALLQSKNSIIYQKLSEEITPQTPKVHRYVVLGAEKQSSQTPKAHKYTPIQQV